MATFRISGRSVLVLLFLGFSNVFANVPVLLWESSSGDKITDFPALSRISCERFNQYMLKKVHTEQSSPVMVLFVTPSLAVEDFSWQDSQRHGYFPNIQNITSTAANVEFLPSVESPVDAVKNLVKYGYKIQYLQGQEFPDDGKIILIVKLQDADADEDRPDLLRKHDFTVAEVYSQLLAKFSHVIALFTASQSSWVQPEELNRVKRDVEVNGNSTNYVLYRLNSALFFSHNATLYDGESVLELAKLDRGIQQDIRQEGSYSTIAIKLKYIKDSGTMVFLNFTFDNKTAGYWTLRTVKYKINNRTVTLTTRPEIFAPHGKSYHSSVPVFYKNGDVVLVFSDLQCEAFFGHIGTARSSASPLKFSAADESVPFFTPAIWCGITVTVLLGLILTWGITMVMDIKTMDQFDDPKGKTITVSATD